MDDDVFCKEIGMWRNHICLYSRQLFWNIFKETSTRNSLGAVPAVSVWDLMVNTSFYMINLAGKSRTNES